MADLIKYISLDNLELYDSLLKGRIDAGDAKSLKTVALSNDGKKLLFYRVQEPVGSTTPAYEIELPEADLSDVMQKVVNAINGHVGIFQNGTMVDSGVALVDLATKQEVSESIAVAIAETNHLTKEIVTVLPSVETAKPNVIYMIKDTTITDGDAYEEWMLIGSEIVPIGTTRVDIENYYTKEEVQGIHSSMETSLTQSITNTASLDATSKADKALADSKTYTNTKTKENADKIAVNEAEIDELNTTTSQHATLLSSHDTRIKSLESGMPVLTTATEEDIMAMFG